MLSRSPLLSGEESGGRRARAASTGSERRRPSYGRSKKDAGFTGNASWGSSVVNLVNTIIGAGVLAMPLALSHMGIALGVLVIIWAGMTSAFGLYLQTRCARYLERGTSSFFALSQLTYPNAAVVFDAAIAIKCFGVGVSYLIIIGDLMPGVVAAFGAHTDAWNFMDDRHFWVTFFMLIMVPLCFLRRLDSLKYTSVIALIAIGYLVILVLAHFIKGDTLADRGPVRVTTWAGIIPTLRSFPVVVFAYTCHQNMFPILNELGNNSPTRTASVVLTSIGSACTTYMLVAITGYLSFGDHVTGNIIAMYPPSTASTISKAAIVIFFMLSYPLQLHPCRASIDAVLKWRPLRMAQAAQHDSSSFNNNHNNNSSSSSPLRSSPLLPPPPKAFSSANHGHGYGHGHTSRDSMSDTRFALITTVIIVASYFTAMTVASLERVLAYVGSTGSTSISFILPGLFYYKISDPHSLLHQQLLKEDDDDGGGGGGGASGNGEPDVVFDAPAGGFLSSAFRRLSSGRWWRKGLLRRLSLALACYGIVVMVVCLVTNTVFAAAH
ncbi:MAG: hypothetical protein M1826_001045 [Phylliscum demangeonii]|nr:MAG: hypothetical protein M1826_001045 [Phylliscum demangeonii]